ncbi:lectin-like protein [Candidatus Magnetobacterium casense]|uniref:lectin-like protein n=1 Tax=Candidatus Magnetobacterium casense TaxID=1455061 RepID=UPI000695BD1D|nr:lectin-like protein [Candidatus Magnetobacterium casensis]
MKALHDMKRQMLQSVVSVLSVRTLLALALVAVIGVVCLAGFAVDAFAEDYTFVSKWGSYGSSDGQFNRPRGVAVDASGYVYIADTENNRIQKFSSNGVFITKWGSQGSGDSQFNKPYGVAVDASGNVYIADTENNRIQKFSSSGAFVSKWGSYGSGDSQFNKPYGVAVDASGNVYVADYDNCRIQKFSSSGAFVSKWGSYGSSDGQLYGPYGIAIDVSGNIYVADVYNYRIQKFSPNGAFITKWGSQGSSDGQLDSSLEVAIDVSGNVYVTDWNNNRIQKFSSSGAFVSKWGSYGSSDGQLYWPVGIAVDVSGNVYVADYGNYRIQKFAKTGGGAKIVNPGNNHTYQRIDQQMKWADAKAYCESLGGYLATVTSDSENKFLIDKLLPADFFDSVNNSYWVGATDVETEGTWKWITAEKWDFTAWGSGEPNSDGGEEDCLMYYSKYGNTNNLWNDGSCSSTSSLICEWNPTSSKYTLTITKQGTVFDFVTASAGPISWSSDTIVASYGSGGCTGHGCTVTQTGTAYYNSEIPVTLKASGSNSKFTGWGGDCATAGQNPICTINMSVNKNVTATFTASLQPSPQIVGRVYSKGGDGKWTPGGGATVTLKSSDGTASQSYTTSSDGNYRFTDISADTYNLSARSNILAATATVTISTLTGGGSTITDTIQKVDLYMTPNAKPLIYLPGIMGSVDRERSDYANQYALKAILPQGKCKPTIQLKIFDPNVWYKTGDRYFLIRPISLEFFKKTFEKNDEFKVFEVPYDWRLSLDDKTTCPGGKKPWEYYLKPVIDRAKHETGYKTVYVVAHSMGGLLTRTYIQDENYGNDIEKFVMLGTPNEGSANAYSIWEGGDPQKVDDYLSGIISTYVGKLLIPDMYYPTTIANCNNMHKSCKTYKEIKKFIKDNVKGLGNLFPTYPLLEVWKDNVNEPPITQVPVTSPAYNKFLAGLNSDKNKSRMKTNCNSSSTCVTTKLFTTNDQKTIDYIRVKPCNDCLYEDGSPGPITTTSGTKKPEIETINGDGTVVAKRAIEPFNDATGNPSIDYEEGSFGSHGLLPASEELKDKIFAYFTGRNPIRSATKDVTRDTVPTTTLSFYLTGGVQPYMTDPQNRTEGVNFTTNQIEENIPDATLGLGGTSSSIFINNPVNGNYTVDLKGNAGLFTVDASSFNLSSGSEATTTKKGFYRNGIFNLSLALDTNTGVLTINSKVAPPTDVKSQNNSGKTRLTWTPSTTADVTGYNIYGKTFDQDGFTLLASTDKDATSFDTGKDWASTDTATVWYYVVTAFDSDVTESLWDTTTANTNPIKADFKASNTTVSVNTPVTFSDLSTGNIVSWQWDFENDGTIDSTSQNPTHSYTAPGTYSVNLYVKDSDGKTDYVSKGAYVTVTSATSTGRVLGSKVDLNGDGKADIVWLNTTSGDVAAWLMDGTKITSGGYLTNGMPNEWQIAAKGDLNGDGTTDIVLQNTTTGGVVAWLMNGTAIYSVDYLTYIPNEWQMVGIGDLNDDGKSDIVWQNTTSGDVFAWLMNGTTIFSSAYLKKTYRAIGRWQASATSTATVRPISCGKTPPPVMYLLG